MALTIYIHYFLLQSAQSIQSKNFFNEGLIWRFRFLMLATLVTACMTTIGFIIGQVSEGKLLSFYSFVHFSIENFNCKTKKASSIPCRFG